MSLEHEMSKCHAKDVEVDSLQRQIDRLIQKIEETSSAAKDKSQVSRFIVCVIMIMQEK